MIHASGTGGVPRWNILPAGLSSPTEQSIPNSADYRIARPSLCVADRRRHRRRSARHRKGEHHAKDHSQHPRRFGDCGIISANRRCRRTPSRPQDCTGKRAVPQQQRLCSACRVGVVTLQRRVLGARGSLISGPSKKSPGAPGAFSLRASTGPRCGNSKGAPGAGDASPKSCCVEGYFALRLHGLWGRIVGFNATDDRGWP